MANKPQILLLLLATVFFSCKSPNENEIPPLSPDMSQPVATGIYITNSTCPEPIGVLGNPSDGSSATSVGYPTFSVNSGNKIDSVTVLKRVSAVSPVSVIPTVVKLDNPYPNPFVGSCVIDFSLPVQSFVELYVVPARWVGENSNDINSSAGAVTAAPKRTAIAILVRGQKSAGMYSCHWNTYYQNRNHLPAGFYRIYLRVGDTVCWHDVLLYNETTDLPVGLRWYSNN